MANPDRRTVLFSATALAVIGPTLSSAAQGCEVLFRVKDLIHADKPYLSARAPKAGDAVVVKPIGWSWGDCELGAVVPGNPNGNHDFFRIVRFENVSVAQAGKLLGEQLSDNPHATRRVALQYRAFHFDRAKFSDRHKTLADHWDDDSRSVPIISVPYTYEEFNSLISKRGEVMV